MTLTKNETRDLYRKRAKRYDQWAQIYGLLFGFRLHHYRQETVSSLALRAGDSVVELGCGTGLNFPYVQRVIGPEGKIIGVDLTDAMLDVAKDRVARERWTNVQLEQADLAEWQFPEAVSGIYSTLALTLVPEYDAIIERASRALKSGGRLAVLDLKEPAGWPRWLLRFMAWSWKPFGVSLALAVRHPWESIRRYLPETEYKEYYFGAVYLCVGKKAVR